MRRALVIALLALVLGCARRKERALPSESDQPAGPRDAVEIVAAESSTCFRTGEGNVRCFGEIVGESTPKTMDVSDTAQIVLSAHEGCAILHGGKVECFSRGARRTLGIDDAAELSAYDATVCARRRSGSIACFDQGNAAAPALPVQGIADATRVAIGGAHRCVVQKDQTVRCWQGSVPELRGVREISAGKSHACALFGAEHRVFCFDENGKNLELAGLDGIEQLAMGPSQSCGAHLNGAVYCWGDKAIEIPDVRNVIQVAVGAAHVCALRRNGAILCWGKNDKGQLGDGTFIDSATAVRAKI